MMNAMLKTKLLLLATCCAIANCPAHALAQDPAKLSATKKTIIQSVDSHRQELIKLSDQIWELAELALAEHKSSQLLADYAENQGFRLERGVAAMPTAFIATCGSGKPIIGVLGEFDALPGLSQNATPTKEALQPGAPGHGCGHNLLGVGGLGAAVAIKELMEAGKIKGTLRYYGTPAEESVGGKIYMADVTHSVTLNGGMYELLVNRTGGRIMQRNLELLGPITYTPQEIAFAKQIRQACGVEPEGLDGSIQPLEETKPDPPGGSTDVADVSWIVPEISLIVTTAPTDTPWHSWAVVACGGMSIGHKGMIHAAKALALTMTDLYTNQNLIHQIKQEFKQRKADHIWTPMIPPGPPPVPNP